MSQELLTIKQVQIEHLKVLPGNPRSWTDEATAGLRESIKRFGLVDPLVVNYDNTVLGGNFRMSVAEKLGYKTAPCVFVDIKDPERAKELSLRLNKNLGEWDWDLLAEFDESLLNDVGFTSQEIDTIFYLVGDLALRHSAI